MVRSTASELSSGLLAALILESITTIISTAKAFTLGLIIENTKATGE